MASPPFILRRFLNKNRNRLLLLFGAVLFALLLSEAIVITFDLDWNMIGRLLMYQQADRGSHEAVDDPRLLYRLKPGITEYPMYRVTINKQRFRGTQRSVDKPDGTFRILCYGGSNVYGLGYQNFESWPAQLEQELNNKYNGNFEVWNGGACAYVASQMAIVAKEGVEKYDPDMVLFGLSNGGGRPFMSEAPIEPYFKKYPALWKEVFTENCMEEAISPGYDTTIFLMRFSALARLFVSSLVAQKEECSWSKLQQHEKKNIEATKQFFNWAKERVPVIVFLYPGCQLRMGDYTPYFRDTDAAILILKAKGMPAEYFDVHPPPTVTLWYARKIAAWLKDNSFLPEPKTD